MTDERYETCVECGAVLVMNVLTGSIFCKICGWSPKRSSDTENPSYIG